MTLVDLPAKGQKLSAAAHFGDIESVKAVSELFAPLGGEVVEINAALADHPELINESPYDKGWMILVRPASAALVTYMRSAWPRVVTHAGSRGG